MPPRGKTVQLNNMYVADFETCDSDIEWKEDPMTGEMIYNQKVWLAGHKNLETMKSKYFYNLDDFMSDIFARGDNVNKEYAFHNLKFDGSFIVSWLLHNGYEVTHTKPAAGQFGLLVDKTNNWYSITVQVTKRRRVILWDLLKLFPMALEYLPNVYSTPTHKIKEDAAFYNADRSGEYIPSERDLQYFENDLQVPAETLNSHIGIYGLRFKKTQASQAFFEFTESFPAWKWRFPPLSIEEDASIRKAYWGGISHVRPEKSGRDHDNISVYDINSSYPDKAANYKLPYDEIMYSFGEGQHPYMSMFWVAEALVEFTLKKDKLPCIPKKALIEGVEAGEEMDKWVDDSEGIVRMRFCCIDYVTINECYDFNVIRWVWSIHWKWKIQKEVAAFVYHNNDIKIKFGKLAKKEEDPEKKAEYNTNRNRAKTNNNGFYGKFGEEPVKEGKTPYLEDGEIVWLVDKVDIQGERARKFLPVAVAITAWGRMQLVRAANILGDDFLYCDTDSVHYRETGQYKIDAAIERGDFTVDGDQLGAWDYEGHYKKGRYLRSKCYMEEKEDGTREVTLAGLPADPHTGQGSKQRQHINWDNFRIGHYIPPEHANKLRTVRTPTGNKLMPVGFRINEKLISLY